MSRFKKEIALWVVGVVIAIPTPALVIAYELAR